MAPPEEEEEEEEELTLHQRARIAHHKQLALAKRLAREQQHQGFGSHLSSPVLSSSPQPSHGWSFSRCSSQSIDFRADSSSCRALESSWTELDNDVVDAGARDGSPQGFANHVAVARASKRKAQCFSEFSSQCSQTGGGLHKSLSLSTGAGESECLNSGNPQVIGYCFGIPYERIQGSAGKEEAALGEPTEQSLPSCFSDSFEDAPTEEQSLPSCHSESFEDAPNSFDDSLRRMEIEEARLAQREVLRLNYRAGDALTHKEFLRRNSRGGGVCGEGPSNGDAFLVTGNEENPGGRWQSLAARAKEWRDQEEADDGASNLAYSAGDPESPPCSPLAFRTPSTRLHQPHIGPLRFSKQQMEVLEAVASRKSVFMTGSAGTGKSYLLGFVIRILRRWLGKESVYVTASTGLAACALNGTTLHSFAGIGLGTGTYESLAGKAMGKKEVRNRWRNAEVLIIDEVSMIDGELFDKLDYVAKRVRGEENDELREKAFGGIQLVVTGDFFQLPPVKPPNPRKYFAFEADCWDSCFDLQIELKHVFRQSDGGFVGMLNEIRKGTHTPQTLETLERCRRGIPDDSLGIAPTRLYPLKIDVKQENENKMKALARETFSFIAQDSATSDFHGHMLQYMRAEKELPLCVGAQVMLIKNLDTGIGLVNGARGVVVGFESHFITPKQDSDIAKVAGRVSPSGKWPVVRFACDGRERMLAPQKESVEDGGLEVASRIQVPLILAWALSVHKCQGMTLDRVETDLSKAFEYGMVYVALSRVKNLDGLHLTGFDPARIKVHLNVVGFYRKLSRNGII